MCDYAKSAYLKPAPGFFLLCTTLSIVLTDQFLFTFKQNLYLHLLPFIAHLHIIFRHIFLGVARYALQLSV